MTRAILYIGSPVSLSSIFFTFSSVVSDTGEKECLRCGAPCGPPAATALLYVPPAGLCQAPFSAFFSESSSAFEKQCFDARRAKATANFPCQRAARHKALLHTRASPWRHSFRIRPAISPLMRRKSAETGQPVRWFRPPPPREVMRYIWLAPFDCQAPFFNFFHPPRQASRASPAAHGWSPRRTTPLTKSQPCASTLTEACFASTSALTCRNVRLLSGWQDTRRSRRAGGASGCIRTSGHFSP